MSCSGILSENNSNAEPLVELTAKKVSNGIQVTVKLNNGFTEAIKNNCPTTTYNGETYTFGNSVRFDCSDGSVTDTIELDSIYDGQTATKTLQLNPDASQIFVTLMGKYIYVNTP